MKFLCLGYYNEKQFEALSPNEVDDIVSGCPAYDDALRESGHVFAQASLAASRETKCLRPKNGKVSITDGPFVETKEVIGAFFIIDAADLDEAVRVASLHPAAHLGEEVGWGVEIRPIDQ